MENRHQAEFHCEHPGEKEQITHVTDSRVDKDCARKMQKLQKANEIIFVSFEVFVQNQRRKWRKNKSKKYRKAERTATNSP